MINPKIYNINLDLKNTKYTSDIKVKQGDIDSNIFKLKLIQDNQEYDLTGLTAKALFIRPDKAESYLDAVITDALKGEMEITLTNQILNAKGWAVCEVKVIGTAGEVLSTMAFGFTIMESLDYNAVVSSNEFDALISAIAEVKVLDTTYAPRLSSVESQLAEKASQSELLQAKSQIDSFVVEAATGMTDAGSLELVATRTDKDGYAHLTAPRRVDTIEKSLTDLEIYALIGDNHIDAESYIGTGINTLNTKIIKLPKGVTLKNNTAYKLYVKLADGTFPTASTVVQFCKSDGTVITGPGFNASFSSAILSQTVYLKFTVYGGAGTVNISEIALVLNGKVYTPFTLAYKSKKVEELVATKSSLMGSIINLYDPLKVVKGFFDTGTGIISGTSDNYKLVYIPCSPNTTYTVRKTIGTFFAVGTSTVIPAAAGTVTPIATSHTAGSITVTTPANTVYLCANVWNLYTDTSITADAMLASIVITPDLGNEYPTNGIYLGQQMIAKEENLSKEVRDLLHSTNPSNWNGKKWISYGDSVTQAGLWQPFITDEFDFAGFEKSGIGGTTVSNANPTDYFCKDTRLATIVMTNPDMVLIMGGTNDHGYNVPIGSTVYPYVESTFKGGLCSTVIKMMAKFPNARIILASPLSGRGNEAGVNMTAPVLNGLGLSTEDYANAVKEVAHFLSIPYIDMYGKTGINQFNRATYLSDTVHPNLAGQKRMAEVAIGELKLINPIA